jgi:hypothetical protein
MLIELGSDLLSLGVDIVCFWLKVLNIVFFEHVMES